MNSFNRNVLKILFLLSFVFLPLCGFGDEKDCGFIQDHSEENFLNTINPSQNEVLKKEELKVVYTHLKQYCCELDLIDENECGLAENYAESPILFDHLIDVGFRKLDGDSSVSYVEVDSAGKKWFEKKKELFMKKDGVSPQKIFDKFKKFWKDPSNPGKNGKLLQKYYYVCQDIDVIYNNLPLSSSVVFGKEKNVVPSICLNAISVRYRKEANLISSVMIKQGSKNLINNMKEYMKEDFAEKKLMSLLEKFAKFRGFFGVVYSKIVEGTENCSGG